MSDWWSADDARRAREQDGIDLPPCVFCKGCFDGSEFSVLVWDQTWAHESCQRQVEADSRPLIHPSGENHQS